MTDPVDDLARLTQLAEAATPVVDNGPIMRARYPHGGGRLALDGESGKRQLILDVFDEANREYYFAVSPDVLLRLVARLRRVEQAATWQPIHTAPKDGTKFIAWGPNDGLLFTAHFSDVGFRTLYEQWRGPITHWMPLPDAPATPTPEGEK